MNDADAKRQFLTHVAITSERIAIMKGLLNKIIGQEAQDAGECIRQALVELRLGRDRAPLTLHYDGDNEPEIKRNAEWVSFHIAGYEALYGLIRSGVLLQAGTPTIISNDVSWFVQRGGGRHGGSWTMPELTACSPGRIIWCRLVQKAILADPDLYLESLAVTNIHQDVIDAISEAIDCLRSELHIAAVVMLGRASEGAWIEMGLGLTDSRDIERKLDGLKKLLHDPDNRMRKSYVAS